MHEHKAALYLLNQYAIRLQDILRTATSPPYHSYSPGQVKEYRGLLLDVNKLGFLVRFVSQGPDRVPKVTFAPLANSHEEPDLDLPSEHLLSDLRRSRLCRQPEEGFYAKEYRRERAAPVTDQRLLLDPATKIVICQDGHVQVTSPEQSLRELLHRPEKRPPTEPPADAPEPQRC